MQQTANKSALRGQREHDNDTADSDVTEQNLTDKDTEKARARAVRVYNALYLCRVYEASARACIAKSGEHPAFKQYMAEMGLTDAVAEFVARPVFSGA